MNTALFLFVHKEFILRNKRVTTCQSNQSMTSTNPTQVCHRQEKEDWEISSSYSTAQKPMAAKEVVIRRKCTLQTWFGEKDPVNVSWPWDFSCDRTTSRQGKVFWRKRFRAKTTQNVIYVIVALHLLWERNAFHRWQLSVCSCSLQKQSGLQNQRSRKDRNGGICYGSKVFSDKRTS